MEDNIDLFSIQSVSEYKDLFPNNNNNQATSTNNNQAITIEQLKLENSKLINEKESLLTEVIDISL